MDKPLFKWTFGFEEIAYTREEALQQVISRLNAGGDPDTENHEVA